MNIAIISPGPFSVPPVKGSSVEHDIDEVSKRIEPEHQVTIYTRKCAAYPRSSTQENRQYIRFAYSNPASYLKKIIRHLHRNKPDVILVENRPRYVLALKKSFPDIPVFVNMHSHVFASPGVISRRKMKRVVRLADGFITNSQFLRKYFIRTHKIPPDKVHAVHLGVDVTSYLAEGREEQVRRLRNRLGLKDDQRVLFYAGRLMPGKGVHVLLKAFRKVARQDPKARLVIVGGPGYGSNRINSYVRRLRRLARPMGNRVKFVRFVPSAKMPLYYQIGDVVATPSVWKEAFCRVNLEAMASGKPVITTPRGGIGEVVTDYGSGFLIPPTDWSRALPVIWEALWNLPGLRQEMGQYARMQAMKFSWDATAQEYLKIFQAALESRDAAGQRRKAA